MAKIIEATNLSEAWLQSAEWLLGMDGGKAVHLNVVFSGGTNEIAAVRRELDGVLESEDRWSVKTVADTIFPSSLYHPHLGEQARGHLYENHRFAMRVHRRGPAHDRETYFNRLVNYPGPNGVPFNQLEYVIDRLVGQMQGRIAQSSAYEMGIQVPGVDRNVHGFPCLSHISLTLERPRLHLCAVYRNQCFITRAYGNYLGLARLGEFIAAEIGAVLGEVECIATHADVEFKDYGKRRVEALLMTARAQVGVEVG